MARDPHRALRNAAMDFLAAFGGDVPDWLREEAQALSDALDASIDAATDHEEA